MSGYVALKPVTLSGTKYNAGELIPAEAIIPSRVRSLKRTSFISELSEIENNGSVAASDETCADFEAEVVILPISNENGADGLPAAPAEICEAVRILQMDAKSAAAEVETVDNLTTLAIIHACDSRSTVKKAVAAVAEAVAQALVESGEAEPGEEAEEEESGEVTETETEEAETGGDA
ncbi:MAG: hypothetical protein LUE24_03025 [Lachnospiraceae bacterium]|nr:hypothetical protein [Lachnospiraceae bacterium]MCD8196132.1 hypothetical protein [Lachnospiraceae bacterium]